MRNSKWLLLILSNIISSLLFSQEYSSPVDLKILLSGTFGELRSNHFHSGIDIKTKGIVGQKIYAIEDGYISRIKVSTWGYGKTLYINHPDGKTSVYAHLKNFNNEIDSIVRIEHYKKENFEINFFPNKDLLKIKKGDFIALSGNSGSSAGPHLHFEIRDTKSERPINPLSLGFNVIDNLAPKINKLKIYALKDSYINGSPYNQIYNIENKDDNYIISKTPEIYGDFGVGIYTYDQLDGSYNKNGVYQIELYVDSMLTYTFTADELDFTTTRYINAHIDYKEKKETRNKYHRCYKLPNNKLNNYTNIINNGVINFNDNKLHLIQIKVSDFSGNTSTLSFNVRSTNIIKNKIIIKDKNIIKKFIYNQTNIFKTKNFAIHMESRSLYESLDFTYNTKDSIQGVFGVLHEVHNDKIPVHKKYILSIKADIPETLKKKVFIAKKNNENNFRYMGGNWRNGFLRAKVREFGNFCIIADTIKPKIKGINIYPGKTLNKQSTIKCSIIDKESGIKSYRAEIDGEWILMEYDHKKNLLRFDINNKIKEGRHSFTLEVIDNIGNITNYNAYFIL